MTFSTVSFIGWALFMVAVLVGLLVAGRRTNRIDDDIEDVASEALPHIGKIAEKHHLKRFGRAATNAPGSNGQSSWYPEAPKKFTKHAWPDE